MKSFLSVIICTHNPRHDYLDKVLDSLRTQTLPVEKWELLLIDNASDKILSSEIDLSWHPQSRHIREEKLGLTSARLRGIQEAGAETLVFVDDDNVLDLDYLEVTLQISKDYSFIGAWGGQIRGEFEVTPPEWTEPYWKYLAIRKFDQNKWSNLLNQHDTTPCGAGMCVRKIVAEKYANLTQNDSRRLYLDRQGLDHKAQILLSCGDTDLAFTACDIGLGTGQFTDLKMTHIMPARRLEKEYLVKLVEGIVYSHTLLDSFRDKLPERQNTSCKEKLLQYLRQWKMSPIERDFYQATKRGKTLAKQQILTSNNKNLDSYNN
ncbi:MAG: glycosyltransferase [Dolichospermum sp. DET50]|nr:glycosyltransferase [Dolichospermum sp. DET66]MBS3032033.1 glycosyltransferase [Dolichospermum sp. DET67]MBS3037242.1 glycosyltransferase [Dolichospermum sp. DET50]QSX69230.1 MAG: glycosyltransferase [Dolichospermum sp. DET69]